MPDVTFRQGGISTDALRAALRDHAPRGRDIAWVGHIAHTAEFEPMTVTGLSPDKHAALVSALEAGGAEIVDHPDGEIAAGGEAGIGQEALVAARVLDVAPGRSTSGGGTGVMVLDARERLVAAAAAAIIVASIIKIAV